MILIGELRDALTTQTAMQAAESGHLVLTTLHTLDAAEAIGRMIEFFPPEKHALVRSILSRVLRGVISQRLLPGVGGGRVPAVEVMVNNARIAELIQDNEIDGIPAAIEDGDFFKMQTFTRALIELVMGNQVERDVAADAATNRHDFLVALDRATKQRAAEERAAAKEAGRAQEDGLREDGLRLVKQGQ